MKIANFEADNTQPFFLIAGPCVIESREFALETAARISDICGELDIPVIINLLLIKPTGRRARHFADRVL